GGPRHRGRPRARDRGRQAGGDPRGLTRHLGLSRPGARGERPALSLLFQYVASGVATGCTFALTATGFVAVYRVTRVVNFAQGMFAVVGGMITYSLLALGLPHGLSEAVAVLLGALVGGDQPLSFGGLSGNLELGPVSLQYQYVLVVVVTALTFVALTAFFDHTYVGKALTACSSNPYAARLMGIDVTRMGLMSFALGGALGALAGV